MNYLDRMTEEEIEYICDVIPPEEVQYYLRQHPKEFAKLKPGFRTTSVKVEQTGDILFNFRNRVFVSSFIEKHINRWMEEIGLHIRKCMKDGYTKYQAYVRTIPDSYFCGNLELYFKLSQESIDPEIVQVISDAIVVISSEKRNKVKVDEGEIRDELEKHYNRIVESKEKEIRRIRKESEKQEKKLAKKNDTINENIEKIKSLSKQVNDGAVEIENLQRENKSIKLAYQSVEKEHEAASKKITALDNQIQKTKDELKKAKKEICVLQEELDKSKFKIIGCQETLRPKEIDQFQEFLGYNMENIGLNTDDAEIRLLIDYISKIVFLGKPIIINRAAEHNVISCIANSLIGTSKYETLIFTDGISTKDIVSFLNNSGRVVCLNGFIGKYDEYELYEIVSQYKSKIVFLPVMYEKTLKYLPREMLSYYIYLNVCRIPGILEEQPITEDSAEMEEVPFTFSSGSGNKRLRRIGNEILHELGFNEQVKSQFLSLVSDERTLNQILLFSVLPYMSDVLNCNPYCKSNRLQKFAGESGKSSYRSTMLEWFDKDYE